jgi:membrane-bound ClpP family serine protease
MHHPFVVVAVMVIAITVVFPLLGFSALFTAAGVIVLLGAVLIGYSPRTQRWLVAVFGIGVIVVGVLLGLESGMLPSGWSIIATVAAIGGLYTYLTAQLLRAHISPANDISRLLGKEGYMLQDLVPPSDSVAQISSEIWTVTSEEALDRNEKVNVKGIDGQKLVVERSKPSQTG